MPLHGPEQAFSLSAQRHYRCIGQDLSLVAWTCDVVTTSFQQQGGVKECTSPTALHPGVAIQWHHSWPNVAVHMAGGSRGVLGGYSPFCPQRLAFSPQCHHATKALSDLHDRALPAPGPQLLVLPQHLTPCIAWLSSLVHKEYLVVKKPTQVPGEVAKYEWRSLFSCCLLFLSPLK